MSEELEEAAEFEEWADYAAAEDAQGDRQPAWLRWSVWMVVGATLVGLVALWPADVGVDRDALNVLGVPRRFHAAQVNAVEAALCSFQDDRG